MNTATTRPRRRALQRWGAAIVLGAMLGAAFGAAVAWRNPERSFWLQVVVFGACTWPILTVALQALWFDRETTNADLDGGTDNVEHSWHLEAAQTAFFTLIGGLIAFETIGAVTHISWLSPVGLPHVLIVGGLTYAGSYAYLRHQSS